MNKSVSIITDLDGSKIALINDIRFNAMVLNINQWLTPLQSSYTQSGSSNTGGAPKKNDDEITSEETIATRDGEKNEGSTSQVE